ncbi:MAG: hypothetical protein NT069_28895, partial [Planctomycetota bacterium]|nr:hypothetical protein [Planctomycetota bacterium]
REPTDGEPSGTPVSVTAHKPDSTTAADVVVAHQGPAPKVRPEATNAAVAKVSGRSPQRRKVVLVSSEEGGSVEPVTEAANSTPDRLRADRLLARAKHNLEQGYRDEALRLAQIAERLELSQRVAYESDEERPSQFLMRLRGDSPSRSETRVTPSTAATAATKQHPDPSSRTTTADSATTAAIPPSEQEANPSATPTSQQAAWRPAEVAADSGAIEVEIPALTSEELESIGATSKRFVRAAHRRNLARHSPKMADRPPSPVVTDPITDGEPVPGAPEPEADSNDADSIPTNALAEDLPADPLDQELSELPVVQQADAPPAPSVPGYWTWNRVSLAGLASGLTGLLLLWIWRELERWHYRLTRPA